MIAFLTPLKAMAIKIDIDVFSPIKVNQQRGVVQQVIQHGREFGFVWKLEVKPELLAVVAMTDPQMPIICNGFKMLSSFEWRCWHNAWDAR